MFTWAKFSLKAKNIPPAMTAAKRIAKEYFFKVPDAANELRFKG